MAMKGVVPRIPSFQLELFAEDIKKEIPITLSPDKETKTDRLFRLIYEESRKGYCFTDPYTGIPWIRYEDIEDKQNGLFVIRFRCPTQQIHQVHFGEMADAVCRELNSGLNFFHETRHEDGLPFEDCVWVLQEDSKKESDPVEEEIEETGFDAVEEFPEDFKDDSTVEEIEARFNEAIENFL